MKEMDQALTKLLTLNGSFGNFLGFVDLLTMLWNSVASQWALTFESDMSSVLRGVCFLKLARALCAISWKSGKCPGETAWPLLKFSNPFVGSAFLILRRKKARKKANLIAGVFILDSCTWKSWKPLRCVAAIYDFAQNPFDVIGQYADN